MYSHNKNFLPSYQRKQQHFIICFNSTFFELHSIVRSTMLFSLVFEVFQFYRVKCLKRGLKITLPLHIMSHCNEHNPKSSKNCRRQTSITHLSCIVILMWYIISFRKIKLLSISIELCQNVDLQKLDLRIRTISYLPLFTPSLVF